MSYRKKRGFEIDNPLEIETDSNLSATEGQEEEDFHLKNRMIAWIAITFLFVVLLGRTFYLQVVQGSYFKDVAENNRIREVVVKAPRGIIRDQFGEVLARNIASFDVVFIPAHLPKEEAELRMIIEDLSGVIGLDSKEAKEIIQAPSENDRNNFLLKSNVDENVAYELVEKSQKFPGIYIGKTAIREYEDGRFFSHIIGYDGKITEKELEQNQNYLMVDNIGKSGLEYSYEKYLHGVHGAHRYEVDSNNSIKEDLGVINPIKGDELILNIDAGLQRKIYGILEKIVNENTDATGAAAVAIDPRNGGVRALVSVPGYDSNLFARGISTEDYSSLINNEKKPLLNRAIAGTYPPGSTFKPFVAAAVLEEGIVSERTVINCHGIISIGSWNFPDWKTHGPTDIKKAIAESCNVFFYAITGGWNEISGLGITRFEQYGKIFGFGSVTGIDLPGEVEGNLPSENWKFKTIGEKWYIGDSYHAGIGQGYVTSTPLQLANVIATIANDGTLYRPRVVREIIDERWGEKKKFDAEVMIGQVVSKESLRIVREGMRQTVNGAGGSARSLGSLKVPVAGKTGTSQSGTEEKLHSWFVSFAPYENPEIAMVILIEGGGEGHEWAVPATKEIYEWLYDQQRGTIVPEGESTNNVVEENLEIAEEVSVPDSR